MNSCIYDPYDECSHSCPNCPQFEDDGYYDEFDPYDRDDLDEEE